MQDSYNLDANDDIDLRNLLLVLWAYKLFIFVFCIAGIIYGGYVFLVTDKKYTSTAIFKHNLGDNDAISIGGGLSRLSQFSNFGITKENSFSIDQLTGRIFIQKLDSQLNFSTDPYFNTYNPKSREPRWKSQIKHAIGLHKNSTNTDEATWQNIVTNFTNNVELNRTPDNSIKISVTHINAQRAAEIANGIMFEIISGTNNKKNKEQEQQLSFLSNTLAKALSDLEVSQSNLKNFALENSALPLENFAAGSLQLDALRDQLSRTTELHEAVAGILVLLKNSNTNQKSYLSLRKKFPIIDQVEFRRVLGQNEVISSWSWPELSSATAVFDTLSERKNRLESQVAASQIDAERSRRALDTYARLERESKIAEATYTVLIEQVKAHSMMSGFEPNRSEIFEYASPSQSPSLPKRNSILVIYAALGLFVGIILSLILANRRDVFFSRKSLIAGAQARLNVNYKTLTSLRNKSLGEMNALIKKKQQPVLSDIVVEIHKSNTTSVITTSLSAKITAYEVALALALSMQSRDTKIAVINFSSKVINQPINANLDSLGEFIVTAHVDNVSVLRKKDEMTSMQFISQKNFFKNIQSLNSNFNLLFLCADNSDAISLLRVLEMKEIFHLTVARTKHTKTKDLTSIRSLIPIQGLLHD